MPALTGRSAALMARHRQSGMSLVELMVGITIGLFIVAAATLMLGNQLADNRRLLLETQVQQDMRATMDIMARQIRRAGTVEPGRAQDVMAGDGPGAGGWNTVQTQMNLLGTDNLQFRYYLNLADQAFGYQLQGGAIKSFIGANLQELTDPNAMVVTALSFAPISGRESVAIPCPKLCPDGTRACWPTMEVRGYLVTLEAHAKSDPTVKRRMQSEVRVRNDYLKFNTGVAGQHCPL